MKYLIKDFNEVLTDRFMELLENLDFDKNTLQQIMNRVSEYEIKNQLRFVNFFANQYIIFERVI